MGHYDYLYEDATREEILERINDNQLLLDKYSKQVEDIKLDMGIVFSKISYSILNDEYNKISKQIEECIIFIGKLNKFLNDFDNGSTISYSVLFNS